jgi:hypothetical protein
MLSQLHVRSQVGLVTPDDAILVAGRREAVRRSFWHCSKWPHVVFFWGSTQAAHVCTFNTITAAHFVNTIETNAALELVDNLNVIIDWYVQLRRCLSNFDERCLETQYEFSRSSKSRLGGTFWVEGAPRCGGLLVLVLDWFILTFIYRFSLDYTYAKFNIHFIRRWVVGVLKIMFSIRSMTVCMSC